MEEKLNSCTVFRCNVAPHLGVMRALKSFGREYCTVFRCSVTQNSTSITPYLGVLYIYTM